MRLALYVPIFLLAPSIAAQASWSQLYPPVSPSPVQTASMACFEPTGVVVMLFGTFVQPATQGWRLQGNNWSPFPMPAQTGSSRGLVYDSLRQRLVVFGGSPANDDTWEWNGATWLHPTPAVRPSARSHFAMAFDRTRGVTVVFGGRDANALELQDLWEWNGTAWTQRAAIAPLGPRVNVLGAFDPVHRNVLLYGGQRSLGPSYGALVLNDTWAWNGTAFTQYTPPVPPPYPENARIVTDLHRQRVIMYGDTYTSFTREWTGAEWVERAVPSPGPRIGHALAYDTNLRRTVMFGGTIYSSWVQDTWIYRTPLPADVVPFGSGCAGTAGTPALAAAPFTLPWLGDTMRTVVQTIPVGEPGALFVSSSGTTPPVPLGPIGMPGCDLLVPIDVVDFGAAVAGRAEWSLTIPNVPALAGAVFRQQAFVRDVPANPLGLTASNAITLTLGVR